MKQYHDLLQKILDEGVLQQNRTGVAAYSIVGEMLSFDMNDGFPAITTKKLAFNAVKGELIGFIRGYTNAADFRALGCNVWDQNANENEAWLNNPARNGEDDLGPIYGSQWRKWHDVKLCCDADYPNIVPDNTYKIVGRVGEEHESGYSVYAVERYIDQLANAVHDVIHNPTSRRIKVEAWNPAEINNMALPPCHTGFQLYVNTRDNELSMTMNQRSCDMFLGIPFNIASYALLLHIIAKATGRKPRFLKMFLTDCHIYENHVEQVKEQLKRSEYALPTLDIPLYTNVVKDTSEEVVTPVGYIEALEPKDIRLINYQSHPAIKATMAV